MKKELKNIQEQTKKIVKSKAFKVGVYTLGVLLAASLIFQAGVMVGFRKASFGRDWRDNYSSNFGPMRSSRMFKGMPEDFPNAHGATGKILKIELPTIIVEDTDGTEKAVIIGDGTQIRQMRSNKAKEDLKVDAHIIVIGAPNTQGQIEAKLIRVLPVPIDPSFDTQFKKSKN